MALLFYTLSVIMGASSVGPGHGTIAVLIRTRNLSAPIGALKFHNGHVTAPFRWACCGPIQTVPLNCLQRYRSVSSIIPHNARKNLNSCWKCYLCQIHPYKLFLSKTLLVSNSLTTGKIKGLKVFFSPKWVHLKVEIREWGILAIKINLSCLSASISCQ